MAKKKQETITLEVAKGDKDKAVQLAIQSIEKIYGIGSISSKHASQQKDPEIEVIPTGCPSFDYVLGGGFARGRISEVYGVAGAGKSSVALRLCHMVQKQEGIAAYVDIEHALNTRYIKDADIDIASLVLSQPNTAEEALDITEKLIRSGGIDLIVVDSVAALVPKTELEGEIGDQNIGLQARLMSKAMRKLVGLTSQTQTHLLFINQTRANIGPMGGSKTTAGGNALKYYASYRMDVARTQNITKGPDTIGHKVKVKVIKNKIFRPYLETELDLIYGVGISPLADVLNCALEMDVFKRSGSWITYNDQSIGQGSMRAIEHLQENPTLVEEIINKYKELKQ